MHPVRKYRLEHNLSQELLAEKLDVDQSLVSHIESGSRSVSPRMALLLETVSGGELKREQLRPELFGPIKNGITALGVNHGRGN